MGAHVVAWQLNSSNVIAMVIIVHAILVIILQSVRLKIKAKILILLFILLLLLYHAPSRYMYLPQGADHITAFLII